MKGETYGNETTEFFTNEYFTGITLLLRFQTLSDVIYF